MKTYLLLPHISVLNANAMSSTITVGIPAMTAWLGSVHALERKIHTASGLERIKFPQMALTVHHANLQVYKGEKGYINSVIGTSNPLDENGKRPPFIELPRIHLEISLLIEVENLPGDESEKLLSEIARAMNHLKLAGGDIIHMKPAKLFYDDGSESSLRKIRGALMPGYTLVERSDLLKKSIEKDSLNALLDYLTVYHQSIKDEEDHIIGWTSSRKTDGWLVPVAIGFHGISSMSKVKNQRDPEKLHQFAENVITLGEYKMPYRFDDINEMMWHYEYDNVNNLYLCRNQK